MAATREFLEELFITAVKAVAPAPHVFSKIEQIQSFTQGRPPLLLAVGKASLAMGKAVLQCCAEIDSSSQLTLIGFQADPSIPLQQSVADHPLPTKRSHDAAVLALQAIKTCPKTSPVLLALSGGASAAWCLPANGISVDDTAQCNQVLCRAGADIHQLNCVRRHISSIKGGQLALSAAPRPVMTLALVDVVNGSAADLGSGPAVGDTSTFAQACDVIRALHVETQVPFSVWSRLQRGAHGEIPENPTSAHAQLRHCPFVVVGDPQLLAQCAVQAAITLGLNVAETPVLLSAPIQTIADDFAEWIRNAPEQRARIAVGEASVRLPKNPGTGGRAQHLALMLMLQLRDLQRPWSFLAAGSDGKDGNSDAAGAIVDDKLAHLVPLECMQQALEQADSSTLLAQYQAQILCGATGTNLTDLMCATTGACI